MIPAIAATTPEPVYLQNVLLHPSQESLILWASPALHSPFLARSSQVSITCWRQSLAASHSLAGQFSRIQPQVHGLKSGAALIPALKKIKMLVANMYFLIASNLLRMELPTLNIPYTFPPVYGVIFYKRLRASCIFELSAKVKGRKS